MALTISSVFTTVLLCSLLILAVCFFSKKDTIMKRISPNIPIMILLIILIRLFAPFEFSYTVTILVKDVLTPFRRMLMYSFSIVYFEIAIWEILVLIWGIGVIVKLFNQINSYRRLIRFVSLLPQGYWKEIFQKYHFDEKQYRGIENIKLVYSKQIKSPYVIGIKPPYLILPELSYSREQLHYIILHELTHVQNMDIVFKIFVQVLCTFFWWNPVIWYLEKEIFQLIEMRNDMKIISSLSEQETVQYMECLNDIAIKLSKNETIFEVYFTKSNLKELKRRLKLISNQTYFCHWQQVGISILAFLLLFLTSVIIIEPYSFVKIKNEGTVLTSKNTYLIINGCKYDVYVYGEYVMTTDNLLGFQNINIYQSKKEVKKSE